jgi:hypothetical protein
MARTTSIQLDLLQEIKDQGRAYWPLAQSSHSSTSQALNSEDGVLGSPEAFPLVGSILARFPEPFNGIKGEESENQGSGSMFDLYNRTEGSIDSMLREYIEGSYEQSNFHNQSIRKEL